MSHLPSGETFGVTHRETASRLKKTYNSDFVRADREVGDRKTNREKLAQIDIFHAVD